MDAVRAQLGSRIVAATGVMNNFDRMIIEGREEDIGIIGADKYYPQVRNVALLAGRFVDAGDVDRSEHVAMLTERLAKRLFGGQAQAVGQDHQAARPSIHRHRDVQGERPKPSA